MDHHGLMVHTVASPPVDTAEHARRRKSCSDSSWRLARRGGAAGASACVAPGPPSSPLSQAAIGRRGPARHPMSAPSSANPLWQAHRGGCGASTRRSPRLSGESGLADSDESVGSGRRPPRRVDGVPAGPAGATPPGEIEPYLAFFAVAREA